MDTCTAITRKGCQCRYRARPGQDLCGIHLPKPDVECPVCYETFPGRSHKITTLKCGHKVCGRCCLAWGRHNSTCPLCRAEVLPKQWQIEEQPQSPRSIIRSLLGEFEQVVMDVDSFETQEEREQFLGFMHWVAYPETQSMPW